MRKRRSNKGALIAVIASLSTVSVVSVGFASWLITGGAKEDVTGSITADQAVDKRYLIELDDDYKSNNKILFKDSIYFGCRDTSSDAIDGAWLTSDSASPANLVSTTYFWVANLPTDAAVSNSDSSLIVSGSEQLIKILPVSIDTDHAAYYNKTVDSKRLFGDLPTPVLSLPLSGGNKITKTGTDTLTYTKVCATVTFAWGAYFGGDNPYDYFNGETYTTALGATAKSVLDEVYKVNGASYSTKVGTGSLISSLS